mmetsp:Transcript_116547/g.163876  ORF Transcript_116547/g.163876 Transcript_116547/m.163876 type:complete len:208 (+) Transcript_116547:56-679(+)
MLVSGMRKEARASRRSVFILAALGCLGLAAHQAFIAPQPTRRVAAAAAVASLLGSAPVFAQDFGEGMAKAGPQGDAIMGIENIKELADSPELMEKKRQWREKESARQEKIYQDFRGWFAEFAQEGTDVDKRVELLGKMQEVTLQEKMLPININKQDVVKGVRAVKFNEGCIKDKPKKDPTCKKLEKAYQKFLAAIDKVYDQAIVKAR